MPIEDRKGAYIELNMESFWIVDPRGFDTLQMPILESIGSTMGKKNEVLGGLFNLRFGDVLGAKVLFIGILLGIEG